MCALARQSFQADNSNVGTFPLRTSVVVVAAEGGTGGIGTTVTGGGKGSMVSMTATVSMLTTVERCTLTLLYLRHLAAIAVTTTSSSSSSPSSTSSSIHNGGGGGGGVNTSIPTRRTRSSHLNTTHNHHHTSSSSSSSSSNGQKQFSSSWQYENTLSMAGQYSSIEDLLLLDNGQIFDLLCSLSHHYVTHYGSLAHFVASVPLLALECLAMVSPLGNVCC